VKRSILAVLTLALMLGAGSALATDMKGALGFHTSDAPIGIRYWMSPQAGLDIGLGVNSTKFESGSPVVTDKASGWNIDVGVPWSVKKWDRVNFILRPGFQYGSAKSEPSGGPDVTFTSMAVTAEFEAEVMVADNFSVSASHGLGWATQKDDRTPENKVTSIYSIGNDWTRIGFHVYLW